MKLSFYLMFVGLIGYVINHKSNIIILFISLEIMFLAITLIIILASQLLDDMMGLTFSIIVLIITGIESTIGLIILVNYYKLKGSLPTNL